MKEFGWIVLIAFLLTSIGIGAGVGVNQFKIKKGQYFKELKAEIAELQKANDSFSMSESIAIAEIKSLENEIENLKKTNLNEWYSGVREGFKIGLGK